MQISNPVGAIGSGVVSGVSAHINGDMAEALVQAYRTYVAKYYPENPPPFNTFKNDFFDINKVIFEGVRADFLKEVQRRTHISGIEVKIGDKLFKTLDVEEIYEMRAKAWEKAQTEINEIPP